MDPTARHPDLPVPQAQLAEVEVVARMEAVAARRVAGCQAVAAAKAAEVEVAGSRQHGYWPFQAPNGRRASASQGPVYH